MKKLIGEIFEKHALSEWGVCPFEVSLPLIECRAKSRVPENAESIIMCLFPYYVGEHPERNLSRYAVIADYHKVAGEILKNVCAELSSHFPENRFEPFVDSSPIREVTAAVAAGVGVLGKNGLVINPVYGSYVFIAEIVTDLSLEADRPLPDTCIGCDACVTACIGGAIENGRIDPTRCASFISQKKGELSEIERDLIKKSGLVWGCDVCSDVCPHNRDPKPTPIKAFYENIVSHFSGDESDEFISSRAYGWRGRAPLLRNLSLIKEKPHGISE